MKEKQKKLSWSFVMAQYKDVVWLDTDAVEKDKGNKKQTPEMADCVVHVKER